MSSRTLIGLAYSPWTERARWALDYHALSHRFVPYTPMLGEPLLRARTRRLVGRISVPVLLTPEGPVHDSARIARYADRVGPGRPLVPAEHEDVIDAWRDRIEVALDAARPLLFQRMLGHPEALAAAVPAFIPSVARPIAGAAGVHYLRLKYGAMGDEAHRKARIVEGALQTVTDALERSGGVFLLGEFTFADMIAATFLTMIRPAEGRWAKLTRAEHEAWTHPELAAKYEDLLHWRDALYDRLRGEHASG